MSSAVRPPLWLWPNLLSLDAPLVAFSWQILFHRSFHLPLPFRLQAALTVSVWLIYVLDRCLDIWRDPQGLLNTARHQFYRTYGKPLLAFAVVIGMILMWMARAHLHPLMFAAGLLLGLIVLGYLILVQRFSYWFHWLGLKETSVGLLFASGVTLNLWIHPASRTPIFYLAFGAFATVCSLNCLLIHSWELTTAGPRTRWLRWLTLLFPFTILPILASPQPLLATALSLSCWGLAALSWFGDSLDPNARRVLVDAVLLTPLLLFPLLFI